MFRRSDAVKRLMATLTMRAAGATQRDVATRLGITTRAVKRYERAVRDGWTPPLGAMAGVAFEAYLAERSSVAKARLLATYATLACEQARLEAADRRDADLRRLASLAVSVAEPE